MNLRKMKFQAIGWTVFALVTLLIAASSPVLCLQKIGSNRDNLSALNQGERTTGTIISKEVSFGSGTTLSPDSVKIKYTFTLSSGQEVVGGYYIRSADVKWVSDVDAGDQIQIAYDKQNPSINLPVKIGKYDTSNVESASIEVCWFLTIFNPLFFSFLTFILVVKASKEWRLTRTKYPDSPLV